jgi:hypothetical protein
MYLGSYRVWFAHSYRSRKLLGGGVGKADSERNQPFFMKSGF